MVPYKSITDISGTFFQSGGHATYKEALLIGNMLIYVRAVGNVTNSGVTFYYQGAYNVTFKVAAMTSNINAGTNLRLQNYYVTDTDTYAINGYPTSNLSAATTFDIYIIYSRISF